MNIFELDLRLESKSNAFSDILEPDKLDSSLILNLEVPVSDTNSPDGQELHP